MRLNSKAVIALIAALGATGIDASHASNIVFQGQNAALFPDANPSNNALMMMSVDRPSNPRTASATGKLNSATLIEQSVASQISAKIYNQIFTSTNTAGTFNLDNGSSIAYTRGNGDGNLYITITDPINGTTEITLPDL